MNMGRGEEVDADWDPALGRVASGIYILTVAHQQQTTGMLASWVMQASFEPPMLTVAVKRGRYVAEWIGAGAPFAVNIVGEADKTLLKHFGRGFEIGVPAFDGLQTTTSAAGVPLLVDTIAQLECERVDQLDSGDHTVFVAHVVGGRLASDERPMLHVRNSGSHY